MFSQKKADLIFQETEIPKKIRKGNFIFFQKLTLEAPKIKDLLNKTPLGETG